MVLRPGTADHSAGDGNCGGGDSVHTQAPPLISDCGPVSVHGAGPAVYGTGDADQAISGGADIFDLVGSGTDNLYDTGYRRDHYAFPQAA